MMSSMIREHTPTTQGRVLFTPEQEEVILQEVEAGAHTGYLAAREQVNHQTIMNVLKRARKRRLKQESPKPKPGAVTEPHGGDLASTLDCSTSERDAGRNGKPNGGN